MANKQIEKRQSNKNFSLFFKANFFLTTAIFILFLQYNNHYKIVDFFLVFLGAISTSAIIYALMFVALYLFRFLGRSGLMIVALIFVLLDLALLIDFFIYRLFKFHINGMVVNILTSPDALDSIQAGYMPVLVLLMTILALVAFEFFLIKRLLGFDENYRYSINQRLNKWMIAPLFLIVFSEKVAYGAASLFSNKQILSRFQVIPLYQPLTFNKIAAKYFDIKPKVSVANTLQFDANLNYPLKPVQLVEKPRKFNIFIFASDSVSASRLNNKTAPNLMAFKKEALILNNHRSGGNSTRFGIFSLLYGLNSSYWFSALNANKGSVLFDVLKELGYQIKIISSTNTNWPEFRKTCYVNVQDAIKDNFEGTPWEKDKQASAYFNQWVLHVDKSKPLFSFMFLDAPHGYSFPKQLNPFGASSKPINYVTVKPGSDEIKIAEKQHKNAIYYNDRLFGEMIETLKQQGLYKDSMIIFTSDHGQEFFEFGDFGHNTNFSSAQTWVPMLIKLPQKLKGKLALPGTTKQNSLNDLTSHVDIVPSLLSLIGVKNPVSDYSNGKNIFDKSYHRNQVSCSNWNKNAIIGSELTYVFSNRPDKILGSEIRRSDTYQETTGALIDSQKVLKTMQENKRFLK